MNTAIRKALDQPQRIYAADGSALPEDRRGEPRAWDEAAHPRVPAGEGGGGQFMSYDEKKNTGTGYGKKGGDADVRKLQEALNRLGLTDSKGNKLEVDGMLGPLTTAAVKKAQQLLGVKADGKVSPGMLKKILSMKKPTAGVKAQHDDKKQHQPKPKPKPKPKAQQFHVAGTTQAEQQVKLQDAKRAGWGGAVASRWEEKHHPRGPDGKFIDELDDFDIDPDVGLPKAKGPTKPKAKPKRPTKAKPKAQAPAPTVTLTDGELDDFDDAPMDLGAPPDLDPPKPKPKDTASHRYGRETVDRFNQVERGQDHTDLPPDWEQDRIDKLESNYGWWEDLPPDKRQAVRDLVAETSRKPTYVRMFPYGLGQTTRDGRMKNVHETRSKTDSYIDERSDYENAVMGLADAADRDKPIYGYIGDIETADAYGPVAVKLKPSVRERTTATVGDSLNGLTQPYGVDQMPDLTDDQLLANIHGGADAQDHLLRGGIQDYMEAQIHGGVDLDDIESVTVDLEPGDTLDDMFEPETLATLRDRGIPVVVSREGGRAGDR